MHIHGNQLDPRNEMYALAEAAKSEAKKNEDERTRRKLLIAAAALPGENDDCVVRLSGDDTSEQHAEAQGEEEGDGQNPEEEASAEDGGDVISDYV